LTLKDLAKNLRLLLFAQITFRNACFNRIFRSNTVVPHPEASFTDEFLLNLTLNYSNSLFWTF